MTRPVRLNLSPPEHECPAVGCTESVPRSKLACQSDWRRLPPELKRAIRATYRERDWPAHRAAVLDAIDWYRDNPVGGTA